MELFGLMLKFWSLEPWVEVQDLRLAGRQALNAFRKVPVHLSMSEDRVHAVGSNDIGFKQGFGVHPRKKKRV